MFDSRNNTDVKSGSRVFLECGGKLTVLLEHLYMLALAPPLWQATQMNGQGVIVGAYTVTTG